MCAPVLRPRARKPVTTMTSFGSDAFLVRAALILGKDSWRNGDDDMLTIFLALDRDSWQNNINQMTF